MFNFTFDQGSGEGVDETFQKAVENGAKPVADGGIKSLREFVATSLSRYNKL